MILLIFSIGFIATIAMTSFSYVLSYFTKSKFEEPQLLNELISRSKTFNYKLPREHVIGWFLHIITGVLFVLLYVFLTENFHIDNSIITGGIYGFFAGLLGVVIWALTFSIHSNPPPLDRKLYYLQLLLAHIVFGLTMVVLLKL